MLPLRVVELAFEKFHNMQGSNDVSVFLLGKSHMKEERDVEK